MGPNSQVRSLRTIPSSLRTISWEEDGVRLHPWPEDPECSGLVVRFAKNSSLPLTALASFPGSGNTWLRYLVQGASGIFTGSIYGNQDLATGGFPGEVRDHTDGSTILQKTHCHFICHIDNHVDMFGGRAIVIIRNPYKAILSYWNLITTHSQSNIANETRFQTKTFRAFVISEAAGWLDVIEFWTKFGKNLYFVAYEDLCKDPIEEIRKLLRHLNIAEQEDRLHCVRKNLEGNFFFRRTGQQHVNPFTEDHHVIMRTVIMKAAKLVNKFNFSLPTDKYQFYNSN